jgi:hypothetical protein
MAAVGAGLSLWSGLRWSPEDWRALSLAVGLGFAFTSALLLALAARPAIEIHSGHLRWNRREIPWAAIRRVDGTRWLVPLVVRLTLDRGERLLLLYAGDADGSLRLLAELRSHARQALLDGVPYREFWGQPASRKDPAPRRYRLLRPEDEEEVERLFRQLKSAGPPERHAPDEKIGEK